MKHESLKIQNIYLKKQNVNRSMIKEVLHILYKNIRFSTFPYLTYKLSSSLQCLKQYNSGNCIAMSEFIKLYLKKITMWIHILLVQVFLKYLKWKIHLQYVIVLFLYQLVKLSFIY